MVKLSSTKPVPGAKKVEDCWFRELTRHICVPNCSNGVTGLSLQTGGASGEALCSSDAGPCCLPGAQALILGQEGPKVPSAAGRAMN